MTPIPVLAGPTASGKTELALRLAQELPLEVISADASMVYRGMDIGTAKPSRTERNRVRHHLVDLLEPSQPFSVAAYVQAAETAIEDVRSRGRIPLVVGGTGYYIRALSEGLFELPEPDPQLHQQLERELQERGFELMWKELAAVSPADAVRVGKNPRRLVRALEVLRRSGIPPAQVARRGPRFSYRKLILWPEWGWLEPRLRLRGEEMFRRGLVEEVRGLLERYPQMPTALQAIGYKEVAAYLRGALPLAETQERVFRATRAYAKRQFTWFRKEPGDVTYLPRGGEKAWEGLWAWIRSQGLRYQA
ncbi:MULTISPECIES: tRNA (adenosine(37)-N6)-dimethylallyltransferase MiaA [unclassified Meiothermus]|uniref:tRNA (adenosine(37)-N6)-dimethylallyltransferase MiaA n=1 Tax=unclassified Meiothermus TaxID=370471 RepID=UPI000D7C3D83|nr:MULTISPECIES: tRNA (adenosine(37)-N6)-dimethylallyltransferase MiaA [unclassified Meiothermus]PZA06564.1 tRNA (adenosine(37)-N6)-dimethylallyltransferase MiaA [Meiothermus sp. Pnk-1]RYM37238.1 tRNA (adenosine(37)-N6)-dimethylallyltransferase MiaA [Meiothermus sp. PNK-Is4]